MTTLSIRIEEKLKKDANKTFSALGMDMSSAVKMFLNQVVVEQGLPFKPSRTPKQIREDWDKEVREALKTKGYKNAEEMFKDLNIKVNV
ncbi:MAG: type II toxin-antitoxin system RelB/DinJ family antitoxin [Candidatus Pacebacteria bacterium]|nr:type II toxin-antitoxin system RelB/DinJ family antitoxin [Candidatus Paceibacterota bacterium]MBP9867248.1 type II toxin-antitoxin system RelB/DinJ family antitoxin [Candidatus Paceibacterota bacterium]